MVSFHDYRFSLLNLLDFIAQWDDVLWMIRSSDHVFNIKFVTLDEEELFRDWWNFYYF